MELKKIGNYLYNPEYIGKGSFSKVYKGYHIDNKDEPIAIKKILISNYKIRNYIIIAKIKIVIFLASSRTKSTLSSFS